MFHTSQKFVVTFIFLFVKLFACTYATMELMPGMQNISIILKLVCLLYCGHLDLIEYLLPAAIFLAGIKCNILSGKTYCIFKVALDSFTHINLMVGGNASCVNITFSFSLHMLLTVL